MANTAPQIATYAHARATLLQEGATNEQLRSALQEATVQLRVTVGRGVSKAETARALRISRPTLDRWIGLGKIRTVVVGKRTQVDAEDLAGLLVEVERLRELGEKRGVVSAAVHHLALRDRDVQKQLVDMLGPGLAALERNDLVPLVVPETFGPED